MEGWKLAGPLGALGKALRCLAAVGVMVGTSAAMAGDRDETTPTAWWWMHNATEAQVSQKAGEGFRLVDIEVEATSPYRFSAAFVHNSGVYASGWWWYFGVTEAQVTSFVQQNNARIVDLEPYEVGGQTRFAVVMISNTGPNAKGWWWLYNTTATNISNFVSQNNARIIDLDTYFIGGTRYYSAVMIPNTGPDQKAWWLYFNVTPAFISQQLAANKARLIDIEPHDTLAGTFTVVMQQHDNKYWWWYYGITESQLIDLYSQNGARIADVEAYYTLLGQKRFAVMLLNNSNELTTKIGEILRNGTDGASGLYLKRIGGPTLGWLQGNRVFEPASTIKALHHVHAMKQLQLGNVTLATLLPVYTGLVGSCPQQTGLIFETLQVVCNKMMVNSDNNRTQAITDKFGQAAINQTAQTLGMSSTLLQHKLGCGSEALAKPNKLTLEDVGLLYEKVATGFLGNQRQTFYDLMLNNANNYPPQGALKLNTIFAQEAAKVGLNATQLAKFKSKTESAYKAGGYTLNSFEYTSIAGWFSLPFKSSGGLKTLPKDYTTGVFVDKATNQANAFSAVGTAAAELLRDEINAAMKTWLVVCYADFDESETLDINDFIAFQLAFALGQSKADCDKNGKFNIDDFICFQLAFAIGCT